MYETFDHIDLKYSFPISFKKRNKLYLRPRHPVAFSWNYGDTIDLVFVLSEKDAELDENFLIGKQVVIGFYNFRRELIYERTFVENAPEINLGEETFTVSLSADVSKSIFKKGSYFCKVTLEDIEEENRKIQTILPEGIYIFYVK